MVGPRTPKTRARAIPRMHKSLYLWLKQTWNWRSMFLVSRNRDGYSSLMDFHCFIFMFNRKLTMLYNVYVFQSFEISFCRWTRLGWKLTWFWLQNALPPPMPSFFGGSNTCQPVHLSGFCWRMLCSCGYKLPFSPYHLTIWTPKPRFKAWLRFSPLGPICARKNHSNKDMVSSCVRPVFSNIVIFFRKQSGFQAFFQGILFCCFSDVYLFMS